MHFHKTLEADKGKIMEQFEHAMRSKAELDNKQRPLMEALNVIKDQIANFESQRNEVTVRISLVTFVSFSKLSLADENRGGHFGTSQSST